MYIQPAHTNPILEKRFIEEIHSFSFSFFFFSLCPVKRVIYKYFSFRVQLICEEIGTAILKEVNLKHNMKRNGQL